MPNKNASLIVPILIITVGSGWLLTVLDVVPEINWVWTLALAVVGVCIFALCGYDKFSFVVGTFFLLASCLSLMRQTDRMPIKIEVPVLVISIGVLMLIARSDAVPMPTWVESGPEHPAGTSRGERLN